MKNPLILLSTIQDQIEPYLSDSMWMTLSSSGLDIQAKDNHLGSLHFTTEGIITLDSPSQKLRDFVKFLVELKKIIYWDSDECYGYYYNGNITESKINMLGHELKNISKKIDENLKDRLDEIESEFETLKENSESLESRLEDIESKVQDFEYKVEELPEDLSDKIEEMESNYEEMNDRLDSLENENFNERINELETTLETRNDDFESYRTEMNNKYSEILTKLTEIQTLLLTKR